MAGGAANRGDAVRAEGLRLAYGPRVALADVSFRFPAGALTALIGSNGSGKSTLLGAVAGLLTPVRGRIEVFGRPGPARTGRVAYVLQETEANELLPVTVREVVAMGRFARRGLLGRLRAGDRRAVDRSLERLELGELAEARMSELSGGQRQRALVAQGLAQEADLLLLDEPMTGLDLVSRARIVEAVDEERRAGRTVAFATHDLADAQLADHVLLLAGRVVAEGEPGDVLTPERLLEAYGPRLVRVSEGGAVLDDEHAHGDHEGH